MMPEILKHELVPEHEVLTVEEADSLLNEFNISKGQLPKILITDPVVKNIKADIGDIIKITRNSQTAGTAVVYRVVVSS
jgi:DNA-directed RNA polymerase subunit H|tara:strand:+ start:435 stop:671 length:237 start_codon:yes stop_codon:yes gene_type:complete